jgi:PAP2 superfamily protein
MTKQLSSAWGEAWKDRTFRAEIALTPIALVVVFRELSAFLVWVENRPGVRLSDPLLSAMPAREGSGVIFALIYLALTVGLAVLARHPRALVVGVQAYVVMLLARICVMYFTALDPPMDMIPLRDPLIEFGGSGRPLTRDLFFSGHTSTLFLLFLAVPDRRFRPVLLACALAVAIGVLRQHAHYTVDVLVAPFFAFASYRAVLAAHHRVGR